MKLAILLLLALIGVVIGFLVYRALIHSARFARLIGGAVEPPLQRPRLPPPAAVSREMSLLYPHDANGERRADCPRRLMARTPALQAGNAGSTPAGGAGNRRKSIGAAAGCMLSVGKYVPAASAARNGTCNDNVGAAAGRKATEVATSRRRCLE